ncbi:hypothetical protein DSECCO2_417500 [anaerobic digester metagenome]
MKRTLFCLLPIVVLLSSCQKEELISFDKKKESTVKETIVSTNIKIQTNSPVAYNDEIIVTAAAAPTPCLDGEIQLFLNKAVSYPVSVQFKIKETLNKGNNLVSGYFTIPAGQRYLTCNIDEYISYKTGRYTSSVFAVSYSAESSYSFIATLIENYIEAKQVEPYLQIWNVEIPSSNIKILANYSILKLSYSLDGDGSVNVSYPFKAGTVEISTLSNVSGTLFYKPTTGNSTDPIVPKDPLDQLPIE